MKTLSLLFTLLAFTFVIAASCTSALTPAPTAPTSNYVYTTTLDAKYQTPSPLKPTFTPPIMGDIQIFGIPTYAAVDAGVAVGGANFTRYTALIGYQGVPPSPFNGPYPTGAIPEPIDVLLKVGTEVHDPISIFGIPNEVDPKVSGVAWATRNMDAALVAISYESQKTWTIPRRGAYSKATSDPNGRVFFSIGFDGTSESFVCYQLDGQGQNFNLLWTYRLAHPAGFTPVNDSSHAGNAQWIYDHDAKDGYVTFSYFGSEYTIDVATGDLVNKLFHPCGYASPDYDGNDGAPADMMPFMKELMNHTARQVVLVNRGPGVDSGNYGFCVLTPDGKESILGFPVDSIDFFINFVPMFFSDHFLYTAVSAEAGGGIIVSMNIANGNTWTATRKNAVSTLPAPAPITSTNDKYFVANMDAVATADKSMMSAQRNLSNPEYLSVVDFSTGTTVAQCGYACAISPIRTFTTNADGSIDHYFVCTLLDYPTTLRATKFVPNPNGDSNAQFTCETYWDVTLPTAAQAVWLNDHTYMSVALDNGGVTTVAMAVAGGNNNNNGGLSRDAIAGVAVSSVFLVAVIGFFVYRFKAGRTEESNSQQRGLEINTNGSNQKDTSYGTAAEASV